MRILTTLLCLILGLGMAMGQVASQGGTQDGYELVTGSAGALDVADKTVAWGSDLILRLDDTGANVAGQPIFLAAEILEAGLPLGVPCIDLDGDPSTCEANLSFNLFLLIDPTAGPLMLAQPASGLELLLPVPADPAIWAAPTTSFRLQGAVLNPASPIGVSVSNFIDHLVGEYTYAGPGTDDGSVEIPLETGFDFFGTVYTSVWVNSNGNLTFGSGDSDFTPTESEMLADQPRIAGMFADLSPNVAGSITASVLRDGTGAFVSATIDYTAVPAFGAPSTQNTMRTVLNADGSIAMDWTAIELSGAGIAGISPGGDLSGPNEVSLTDGAGFAGGTDQAIYEVFTGSGCGEIAPILAGFSGLFSPSGTSSYTYTAIGTVPTLVNGITPASGSELGGEVVTLDGQGFDSSATYSVDFGGNPASNVAVVDACTLEATTPAGAVGTVDVTVSEVGGFTQTLVGAYTYNQAGVVTGSFNLSDDGSANYTFSSGTFTFFGVTYSDLWVNANGNITFGAGDGDFTESISEMEADLPRIAFAWDDHNPSSGGTIDYVETPTDFTLTFNNVPAYTTGDNSYTVVLDKVSGLITMSYGTCTSFNGTVGARSVLVGISAAAGAGIATPISVNLVGSTLGGSPTDALYEYLNVGGAAWALDGDGLFFTPTGGNGVGPYQFDNL